MRASELLYDWNSLSGPPNLNHVEVEDDTLRDGLQGAFVIAPPLETKKALVASSSAIGVQYGMLGFPASSPQAFREASELNAFIASEGLSIKPHYLGRATPEDMHPIIELDRSADVEVWADFFIGCSPVRRYVEGWDLDDMLRRIAKTGETVARAGTRFGVSLEDVSRTDARDIEHLIRAALECGGAYVALCDTVGACTPHGAAALVSASCEAVDKGGAPAQIWWHGHNDRGLALANSIAAAEAGAQVISGTFLGMGERAGNAAVEQVIVHLAARGHPGYRLDKLMAHCELLATACETEIPGQQPLVGRQAFTTATGTHAAAILKARQYGRDFEDLIFSSVEAMALGRRQGLLLGPTSGIACARLALEQLGYPADDGTARRLLEYARTADRVLTDGEVHSWNAGRVALEQASLYQ